MATNVWEDREIRFDVGEKELELRKGEMQVGQQRGVEDTKGNNGNKGRLIVTNLRFVWHSLSQPFTNLTVGLDCIGDIKIDSSDTKLRGLKETLRITTKAAKSRLEFIFSSCLQGRIELFHALPVVHRSFETTKLYREVRPRSCIFENGDLRLLPKEQLYSVVGGVVNVSGSQGNLGTMYVSNVRVVWRCDANANFNISIPFMHIKSIRLVESKQYGSALLVMTGSRGGGYSLGFRIDPIEKLKTSVKELQSLHQIFGQTPIFGVDFDEVEEQLDGENDAAKKEEENDEKGNKEKNNEEEETEGEENYALLDDDEYADTIAAYYAHEKRDVDGDPVYCPELGLAIEGLKEGFTIDGLWQVLPILTKEKSHRDAKDEVHIVNAILSAQGQR